MTTEIDILNRWLANPADQKREEIASLSHETHRIPDPYTFLVQGEKLISPSNGIPIERVIRRLGRVEEKEYEAFQKIQRWASENESGTAVWFSPPTNEGYINLKIVLSEIKHFPSWGKILFNRAFIIDVDERTTLALANKFPGGLIWNVEELRGSPKFLTSQESLAWPEILGQFTTQTMFILGSQDMVIKQITLDRARGISSYGQARRSGLIGKYPDSCGAFGFFFSYAEKTFPCPACGWPIPSGRGIEVCPHCKAKKSDNRVCV